MSSVEKFIGESQLKSTPTKKFTFIIDDEKVTTAKIADNAITEKKISGEDTPEGAAVTTSKIKDGAVTNPKIANGAVTTIKIQDFDAESSFPTGVTNEKLADASVTESKLASGAVTEGKIASNAVTTAKIADYNVTTDKIANYNVTEAKLAPGAVTTDKLSGVNDPGGAAVTADKIAPNAVVAGNIADGAVQAGNITGTIGTEKLGEGCVLEGNIAPNAVTTDKIGYGAVTMDKIDAEAINEFMGTIDPYPIENSTNIIRSGNVYPGYAHQVYLGPVDTTPEPSEKTIDADTVWNTSGSQVIPEANKLAIRNNIGALGWNDVDAFPTAGSVKPVQSGGVFNAIAEAGVINISEMNKVDTTPAKYSSLSDALAAIPAAYQRGGMSIKFVQSSDNKYVQYRLMSDTFNTTVANWQGVDDEPTAGSDNLVKSRGVNMGISLINVNYINGVKSTPYNNAVAARTAVPSNYRRRGIMFCYLLADGWHVEQYIGNNPVGWAVNSPTLWKEYDYKKEHLIYNVNYNPNAQTFNVGYTLAEAIAAVPAEYRAVARAITYHGKDDLGHIAIFNLTSYMSSFENADAWSDFSGQLLNDFYKLGRLGGAVTGNLTCESPDSRVFLVGDSTKPGILIEDDKFYVDIISADSYGFWRFYIFYDDGTKAFASITAGKNVFTKKVKGVSICVNSNSNSCYLNYALYVHLRYDIISIEGAIAALQERTYTAAEVGAVGIAQGIGNVGKSLIVGSDGNVTLGEPSPIGELYGYGKIQSTIRLYLKADIAEEVSVGAGWSGNLTDGYTHATGNTDTLVLGHTEVDKKYLVTLNFSDLSENTIEVKIGNGYAVDPYNGSYQSSIGFISDGGDLIVIPNSSYTGTIHVKLQEVTDAESATEDITLTIDNFDAGQLVDNISGFWNTALGGDSTMIHIQNASRNIALGNKSLAALISGSRNIGVGTFALAQLKNGKGNIGIGADTYYRRQGGNDNVAIGRACMGGATESVNNNTCVGRSAGERVTGDDNVCIGTTAGYAVTSGNVCIGVNAGFSHNAGVNNIFIGRNAGYSGAQRTGTWNTAVGPSATIENGVSKSVAIGFQAKATKSNQVVLGNYSETAGNGTVETLVHGDLVIRGTDGIMRRIVFNQDYSVSWETVS